MKLKLSFALFFALSTLCWSDTSKIYTIAITQITAHPAIDAVREGLKQNLKEHGLIPGKNIKLVYENAYGNIATANQIAQKFVGINPDIIIAITTPSAQSVLSGVRDKNIPVVFAGVTDPVGAKLVESLDKPGKNITGTADLPPLNEQLNLIHEMMGSKPLTLGIVYNLGEANSVFQVEQIKKLAPKYGIKVIAKAADNSTKVLAALQQMLPKINAFYAPLDNVVASALPSIVNTCKDNSYKKKIPVFASDPEGVRQGALATIGFTHFKEGQLAGLYVKRILAGETPQNIPVTSPEASELYINTTTAKELNFKIPSSLLEKTTDLVRFE